jgi:hypothetical protein
MPSHLAPNSVQKPFQRPFQKPRKTAHVSAFLDRRLAAYSLVAGAAGVPWRPWAKPPWITPSYTPPRIFLSTERFETRNLRFIWI